VPPIDPLGRWAQHGEKPDYAGLLTFGGAAYTEDPADLQNADVAIAGAPMDDLVSDRPGARLGPRAIRAAGCPPGPHLEARIDAFAALRILDFGDAPVVPGDPARSHEAIEALVDDIVRAGAIPVLLGGDHGIAEPSIRACARAHGGPLGLVHFDAHTDTGEQVFGSRRSHGTPMRHVVDDGHVDGARYVQIGLRGYWPGPEEFAWQESHGITSHFMHDVRERGIDAVVEDALARVGDGATYLSIDIDVLDPSVAPGTGTPEPGGMSAAELLRTARTVAQRLDLVGADLVEVAPREIGSADITAVVADRVVREVLTGIALRRAAR
jgi:agmatinase